MDEKFKLVFKVGKRVWIIRALMWGMLGMSYLLLSLIWNMPIGEDETVSRAEEIGLIIFVIAISIAFPLGMHIYATCYVARVIANEDESISFYDTIGWIGFRRWTISKDEKGREAHHKGFSKGFYSASADIAKMEVNAPYTSQKVKQRKLPFILDHVGDWYDWHEAQTREP